MFSSAVLSRALFRPVNKIEARVLCPPSVVSDVCMSSSSRCRRRPLVGGRLRCPVGCGRLHLVMWSLCDINVQYWHSQCPTHCRQCPLLVRRRWMSNGSQFLRHCCSLPCLLAALVRPHRMHAWESAKVVRKCWLCQCISVRSVRGRWVGPYGRRRWVSPSPWCPWRRGKARYWW